MQTNLAQLDAEQLNRINSLADEMGVILVAYHNKGTDDSPSNEVNSNALTKGEPQ